MTERSRLFWIFLAGGVLAGGIAIGVPHDFAATQPVSAAQMNANFQALEAKFAALQNPRQCGFTAETLGRVSNGLGDVGYPAIKSLCVQACGSPTAHGCRADEIVRIAEAKGAISPGWYESGVWSGADGSFSSASNDCKGWTSSDSTLVGAYWIKPPETPSGLPGAVRCDDPGQGGRKFLCCE